MKITFAYTLIASLLASSLAFAAPKKAGAGDPTERGGAKYITGKAPRTLEGGWILNWNDEFEGTKLDESKWAYELGVIRNPGSLQAYCKDCVKVKNGMLQLHSVARPTKAKTYNPNAEKWPANVKEQPYGSGSVTTRNVKHFTAPGRLEFRARIPKAKGVWPAIWTMHVNNYRWPANGEIDLLEHISQEPNTVYTVFRWGKDGTQQEYKPVNKTTQIPNLSEDFHIYVLEWDESRMVAYIDDKEVASTDIHAADYPDGTNPLLSPCFIIMNTAIGGWAEGPNAKDYPVVFEIDYVRYYTKKTEGKAGAADDSASGKEQKSTSAPKSKKSKKKSGLMTN